MSQIMDRHAVLPAEAMKRTISDMLPGESGWAAPWAMTPDSERRCWLHPRYTILNEPVGTVQMRVERFGDGFYHVWLVPDYRYHAEDVGPGSGFIPVAELHAADQ